MKTKAIVLLVLGMMGTMGMRGQRALDTLHVNEFKNVALFFPSPIERAVTGHEGFVFSYDRDKAANLGLLQGVDSPDSNLLVITADGLVYSFILNHSEDSLKLHYTFDEGKAIGSLGPKSTEISLSELPKKDSIFQVEAMQLLLNKTTSSLARKRKKGLVFKMEDMHYSGDTVFLVCNLKNVSGIDFRIGHINVHKINGSGKKRASYQEIAWKVGRSYGIPKIVKTGESQRFLLQFPRYVLGLNEQFKIVLLEGNGGRRIEVLY